MMKKLLVVLTVIVILACGSSSDNQVNSKNNNASAASGNDNMSNQETASQPAEDEKEVLAGDGEKIYKQYCMACHQANGQGVQGMYPTLIGTEYVTGEKERLIGIILNGMQGEIEVKGETFNNIMPSHNFLSDQEVADVLTYVRQMGENDASEVTPEEVKEVRNS